MAKECGKKSCNQKDFDGHIEKFRECLSRYNPEYECSSPDHIFLSLITVSMSELGCLLREYADQKQEGEDINPLLLKRLNIHAKLWHPKSGLYSLTVGVFPEFNSVINKLLGMEEDYES